MIVVEAFSTISTPTKLSNNIWYIVQALVIAFTRKHYVFGQTQLNIGQYFSQTFRRHGILHTIMWMTLIILKQEMKQDTERRYEAMAKAEIQSWNDRTKSVIKLIDCGLQVSDGHLFNDLEIKPNNIRISFFIKCLLNAIVCYKNVMSQDFPNLLAQFSKFQTDNLSNFTLHQLMELCNTVSPETTCISHLISRKASLSYMNITV